MKTSLPLKLLLVFSLATLLFGCDADLFSSHQHSSDDKKDALRTTNRSSVNEMWEMVQTTEKQHFQVKFSCKQQPFVGDFQDCNLILSRNEGNVSDAVISIDGGMKAHGHGLPTSPKLSSTDIKGQYKIEGLKFSMPGDWIVGFRVLLDDVTDQTVFKFSI